MSIDQSPTKCKTFFNVFAYFRKPLDALAELCAERVKKGDKIAVFGDFETVVVEENPDRQPGFLIKASAVEFLTPRKTMGEAVAAMFGGIAGEDAA